MATAADIVRQVTEADARHDTAGVNRILSTFVVVYSSIGLVAAVGVVGLIVFVVPHFPGIAAEQVLTAQVLLAIIGLRVVVGFPMAVFGAVTNARQRFALNNSVALVLTVLNGLARVLGALGRPGPRHAGRCHHGTEPGRLRRLCLERAAGVSPTGHPALAVRSADRPRGHHFQHLLLPDRHRGAGRIQPRQRRDRRRSSAPRRWRCTP